MNKYDDYEERMANRDRLINDLPHCTRMLLDIEKQFGIKKCVVDVWQQILYKCNQDFFETLETVTLELCTAFQTVKKSLARRLPANFMRHR